VIGLWQDVRVGIWRQTGLPEFVGILSLLHRRFACSERFDGLQNAVSCRHTIT
jgi:hypothetical protein